MSNERYKRILQALAETDRFIDKESIRADDIRPDNMQKHLDFCIKHKQKLTNMLSELKDKENKENKVGNKVKKLSLKEIRLEVRRLDRLCLSFYSEGWVKGAWINQDAANEYEKTHKKVLLLKTQLKNRDTSKDSLSLL